MSMVDAYEYIYVFFTLLIWYVNSGRIDWWFHICTLNMSGCGFRVHFKHKKRKWAKAPLEIYSPSLLDYSQNN
jgi:hypothetical protein